MNRILSDKYIPHETHIPHMCGFMRSTKPYCNPHITHAPFIRVRCVRMCGCTEGNGK